MGGYYSDSSLGDVDEDQSTGILLGYASKEPTEDAVSHLGGEPEWLEPSEPPPASLAQCKACRSYMSLLLQLNADLPDRFPDHERRLYLWTCRRKTCRRQPGSVRAFRATRVSRSASSTRTRTAVPTEKQQTQKQNVGAALFGATNDFRPSASTNPFATSSTSSAAPAKAPGNPFAIATSSLAAKPPQKPSATSSNLSATFAEKLAIDLPDASTAGPSPDEAPWPSDRSLLPQPFPKFYLDAETEFIDENFGNAPAAWSAATRTAFMDRVESNEGSSGAAEDKMMYEDTHDATFQRFADRVAQNPEQVLRYDFGGAPLLYSDADSVGKSLKGGKGGMPRCGRCGAERVFETQMMPAAIAELEGEMGIEVLGDGMEWGSVVVGVCSSDCAQGVEGGTVAYYEEWVGVQWEETVNRK